jgi:hypothetical protein
VILAQGDTYFISTTGKLTACFMHELFHKHQFCVTLFFCFYNFWAQVFTHRLHTVPHISSRCRNAKHLTIFVGGTLKVVATLQMVCCFSWIGSSLLFTLMFVVVAILMCSVLVAVQDKNKLCTHMHFEISTKVIYFAHTFTLPLFFHQLSFNIFFVSFAAVFIRSFVSLFAV